MTGEGTRFASAGCGLLLGLCALAAVPGCRDDGPASRSPGEIENRGPAATGVLEREGTLEPFLSTYWELPVPPQGPPPPGWSPAERSLAPEDCAPCHPAQHAQWSTSLHGRAYSPGFSGQLIEGDLALPAQVRQCQTCHAPLSEQQPHGANGSKNATYAPALRQEGIVCAACHVRGHRRFGPPRRTGLPPVAGELPHGGFEARPEFEESRFCAECHQFFDDPGIAGKPIQNTYAEWLRSPAAADGRTCQSCHMPDRAHLWRGIHDPDMVRAAVTAALDGPEVEDGVLRARLVLRSHGVGHAFPTYVTPRVFLAVWQQDAAGRQLEGTRVEDVVGRQIDFGRWEEVFDTRIPAGGSRVLLYEEPLQSAAVALVGQVRVDPDFHYRDVFGSLSQTYAAAEARERIREAHRRTLESSYILHELRRELGRR